MGEPSSCTLSHCDWRRDGGVSFQVAWQVADRVQDIDRSFALGMDLGCGRGHVAKQLDGELIDTLVRPPLHQLSL
jgi:hypothetical protein